MEVGIEAARWVVGRALGTASGGVLEAWAASSELGPNIRALRMELLYAQGMLNNARSRGYGHGPEIQNPALGELLRELRDQAFRADDVLDELDGTYHAADEHGGGCLRTHALNARHTAINIRKMLGFSNSSRGSADHDEPDEDDTSGRGVKCGACPCLGPKTTPDDDEQEEDAGGRGALCEAVWPYGRATPALPRPPPTNQSDQAVHAGCMARIASAASDIINTVGKRLPCYPDNSNAASPGRRFLCCARPNKAPQSEHVVQAPELKFDRVEMSRKMKEIVEQLKPLCAKVSAILNIELLDSSRSIVQCIGTSLDTWFSKGQWPAPSHRNAMMSRPITTPEFREPELYGREHEKTDIIFDITKGKYCEKDLTVLPIVGPGGREDNINTSHFEVKLWVCVSVNFNVHRLTQEIADKLTDVKKDSPDKQIEEQLKSKRILLVLDDMWDCSNEDEWKRFLLPFKKGQTKDSVILVTTRFPALAQMIKTTSHWKDLKGIDSKSFKELFRAYAFGDKQSMDDHNELQDTGDKIVKKLKGSPLAAKTVGRLLRNNLDLGHWTRVLESKEWESQNEVYDIMPALKLSFDYLPFHLQQCFTYCALFPEDYKFSREELIHFWIGLDIVHSHGENKRIEDIGRSYLTELARACLAHGCLRKLCAYETPNLFTMECSEGKPEMLELSSKLQSLIMDDVAGVLAAPVCTLLSSSLTTRLYLQLNEEIERFTKERDEALQLPTGCIKLQCLPAGLQRLTNLKRLLIRGSPAIHSLHKGSLPGSLQQLEICSGDIRSLPKDSLPSSLRRLEVSFCSSLRSLPKDGLPNSLEELEISCCPSIRGLPKGGQIIRKREREKIEALLLESYLVSNCNFYLQWIQATPFVQENAS
ncbi:putative disease resistance protein RGA4 [Panicum miliaceum]|uniref:Disease resistance protein RGA4 n=1 Tax=Panicum miliaceum TaxID=4540 RepID=A0A3L6QUT2_PANMI|nr:putative disease resistance protein RGA4 [Panicum miliaceum]